MKKEPCQAVVIRVTPDTTGGEALNIGVVLHSPAHAFLGARFTASWRRITEAFPDTDAVHLRRIAGAIERACEGTYQAQLDLRAPERAVVPLVRAIVPDDDAGILLSAPLSGLTGNPSQTLDELFARFVVRGERAEKVARQDLDVWKSVATELRGRGIEGRLSEREVGGEHYRERFRHAWKNSHWHVARPLSFDLRSDEEIVPKAAGWSGRVRALDPETHETTVVLVVGLPPRSAPMKTRKAGDHAVALLREQLTGLPVEIVHESEAARLADRIARDLAHEATEAE